MHKIQAKKAAEAEGRQKQTEETLRNYDKAFDQMLKLTQAPGSDKLVERYIHNEDRNFSLFNYVGEVYEEIEKLQTRIDEVSIILLINNLAIEYLNACFLACR